MEAWIIAATLGPLGFLGVLLAAFALRRARTTATPSTAVLEAPATQEQQPTQAAPAGGDPCDPANMPTGGSVLDMSEDDLNWLRRMAGGAGGAEGVQVNITVAELAAELCRSDRERDKVRAQHERVAAVRSSVQRVIRQDGETSAQQAQLSRNAAETNSLVEQMRRDSTAATVAPAAPATEEAAPIPTNGGEEDVPPPHTPVDLR